MLYFRVEKIFQVFIYFLNFLNFLDHYAYFMSKKRIDKVAMIVSQFYEKTSQTVNFFL